MFLSEFCAVYAIGFNISSTSMVFCIHMRSFFQNAHAYVNAAFLVKFSESRTFVDKPRLVFGGISGDFVHASKTEEFLIGKRIDSEATFSGKYNCIS